MSSNRSVNRPIAEPLILEPQPSRLLATALLVLHLGAIVTIFLLNGPPWLGKLFLLGLMVFSGIYYWKRVIHAQHPNAIKRLTWRADGEWLLEFVSGETLAAELLPNAYVLPWLVVVGFRDKATRKVTRLALFQDAVNVDVYRNLRVRLRLQAKPS